jgi:hypothetical protein
MGVSARKENVIDRWPKPIPPPPPLQLPPQHVRQRLSYGKWGIEKGICEKNGMSEQIWK